MVPEIESASNRIFCHFRLVFALLTPLTLKIKILKKSQNFDFQGSRGKRAKASPK